MSKFLTACLLVSLAFVSCVSEAAGPLNARGKKEMQAITTVIEKNLRASNEKNVDGVMATMTPYTPNREEFMVELQKFFSEVDVYMRVVSVEFVSAEMTEEYGQAVQAVTVKVVQETIAAGDDKELPYSEFREHSAMLPPWEVCEFELVMHKVRGKWLAHTMNGDVCEVGSSEEAICEDGSCSLTNVGRR
jgi:hypothetical protein